MTVSDLDLPRLGRGIIGWGYADELSLIRLTCKLEIVHMPNMHHVETTLSG